jgi:hypothetical protein
LTYYCSPFQANNLIKETKRKEEISRVRLGQRVKERTLNSSGVFLSLALKDYNTNSTKDSRKRLLGRKLNENTLISSVSMEIYDTYLTH